MLYLPKNNYHFYIIKYTKNNIIYTLFLPTNNIIRYTNVDNNIILITFLIIMLVIKTTIENNNIVLN